MFRDAHDLLALLASEDDPDSSNSTREGTADLSRLGRAVAELEGLVGDAALRAASVTLRRAAGEGADAFDLTPLRSNWRPWSDYERLNVQIN